MLANIRSLVVAVVTLLVIMTSAEACRVFNTCKGDTNTGTYSPTVNCAAGACTWG